MKRLLLTAVILALAASQAAARTGEELLEAGRYRGAVRAFEARMADRGPDADSLLGAGVAAHKMKWFSRAAAHLEALVLDYPDHPEADKARRLAAENYRAWGYLFYQEGDKGEALAKLEAAVRLDPDLFDARYWLARVYDETGRYEQAADEWAETLRLDPDNAEAAYWLKVNQGYRRHGAEVYALYEEGYRRYADGELGAAVELWLEALDKAPGFAAARFWVGRALFESGDYARAAAHLGAVVEADPENRAAAYLLTRARNQAQAQQPPPGD